jgi:nitroreductase
MALAASVDRSTVTAVVEAATLAPSVHNTQPWRFVVGDNAGHTATIELYADRERSLPALDPTGRQLLVSCGAALLHAQIGARSLGLSLETSLLPDADPDHLATLTLRPGQPPSDEDQELSAATRLRHTQREPFDTRSVDPAVLDRLRAAAAREGGWLHVVERRDDQITLAVLLAQAEHIEQSDPKYREELHSWVRPVNSPARDGVPASALPHTAGPARHSEVTVRDFDLERTMQELRDSPTDERPTVVILGTDADTHKDQLLAGMALARVLLEATRAGVVASPLGQVVDLPGTRTQLRQQLTLLGEPQMLLRIGYGAPAAATPRRPVSDVLTDAPPSG